MPPPAILDAHVAASKRACDCCNIRKIKCDGCSPCLRCVAAGITCTSLRERKKSGPRGLRQSRTRILKQQAAAMAAASASAAVMASSPSSLPSSTATTDSSSSSSSAAIYVTTVAPDLLDPRFSVPADSSSQHHLSSSSAASSASHSSHSSLSSPALSVSAASTFALDDQPLIFTGTVLPAPPWDLHRIALPVLRAVLQLYNEKLYGIWPLIHARDLVFRLETQPDDPELYALAAALSGATLSYLDCGITHDSLPEPLSADAFVNESRRARASFDYMEPVGVHTVLTSYFLHMHYGRHPARTQMAAFYVREAITFAHLLGLHNESTYAFPPWTAPEQAAMRRLYFLLFMTERYLCIQQGLPTVLESISLPDVLDGDGDEQFRDVVGGFVNLITSFSTPGSNFYGKWTSHGRDVSINREQLLLIQRALQRPLLETGSAHSAHARCTGDRCRVYDDDDGLRPPCPNNPIQLVDIVVSQHWIRSLAWKLSILLGYVSPTSSQQTSAISQALSVSYPLEIATDTLRGIQTFPPSVFEVHGPGMEVKMCEIATALADSILCSPSDGMLGIGYSSDAGSRTILKSLADRIFETRTMSQGLRDALASKMQVLLKCSDIPTSISLHEEQDTCGMQRHDEAIQYMC